MKTLNQQIIETNKPKLDARVIHKELQARMVPDPVEAFNQIEAYIQNLLIWQKELVTAQLFDIFSPTKELGSSK